MCAFVAPADQGALPADHHATPAFVHYISLSDESISPALRGIELTIEDHLAQVMERFTQDALAALNTGARDHGSILSIPFSSAEHVINLMLWGAADDATLQSTSDRIALGLLRDIAAHLPDGSLVPEWLRSAQSEHELVGVLEYASSEQRLLFITTLLSAVESNPHAADFLISKLDNAMFFLSLQERSDLLGYTLESKSPHVRALGAVVLRGCRSLDELQALVQTTGVEQLRASGSPEVRELVALTVLLCQARADGVPNLCDLGSESVRTQSVRDAIDALTGFLDRRMDDIESDSALGESQAAKELLLVIAQERSDLALLTDAMYQSKSVSAEHLVELQRIHTRLTLEMQYGILLSRAVDEHGATVADWSLSDLSQARSALERLPEGMLLTTPMLFEIQRCPSMGEGILGVREPSGTIRITDYAVDNRMAEFMYPGASSLERTLVHEIGHALQLGSSAGGIAFDRAFNLVIEHGDERYDFDEFMALSGWEVVDPARFEIRDGGLAVVLDGIPCPIGVPVQVHEKVLMLIPVHGMLFVHDASAGFSLVPYSRTNPWEDWAEAFAEYFTLPERLIAFAPEKFAFLEQEFRHYHHDVALSTRLAERLKANGTSHPAALAEGTPSGEDRTLAQLPQ